MDKDVDEVSKVIIACDGRLLFLQKNNKEWELPGGHLNEGESFMQGAMREVFEETGIRLKKLKLILNQKKFNMFFCKVRFSKVKLSNEHINFMWCSKKDMKRLKATIATYKNWKLIKTYYK